MVPHCPIHDTALAACLATLGVPLDPVTPFERRVDTDDGGRERTAFLFRDASETDPSRRTEELVTAWNHRARFEADFPGHPLVPMRAAIDARAALVAYLHGERRPAREYAGERYLTPHLFEAALLAACRFPFLGHSGRAFAFPARTAAAGSAAAVIAQSQAPEGSSAPQWMFRVLLNLNALLGVAKDTTPILQAREGEKTLLLSAAAPRKLRDRFYDLLAEA